MSELFKLAEDEGGCLTVIVSYAPELEPLVTLVKHNAVSALRHEAHLHAKAEYEVTHREQMERDGGEAWYWRQMAEHFAGIAGQKHVMEYVESVRRVAAENEGL